MASHRLIQRVGKRHGPSPSEDLCDRSNACPNDEPRPARGRGRGRFGVASREGEGPAPNSRGGGGGADVSAGATRGRARGSRNAPRALRNSGVARDAENLSSGGRERRTGPAGPDPFVRIFGDVERRGEAAGGPMFGDMPGASNGMAREGSRSRDSLVRDEPGRAA